MLVAVEAVRSEELNRKKFNVLLQLTTMLANVGAYRRYLT